MQIFKGNSSISHLFFQQEFFFPCMFFFFLLDCVSVAFSMFTSWGKELVLCLFSYGSGLSLRCIDRFDIPLLHYEDWILMFEDGFFIHLFCFVCCCSLDSIFSVWHHLSWCIWHCGLLAMMVVCQQVKTNYCVAIVVLGVDGPGDNVLL